MNPEWACNKGDMEEALDQSSTPPSAQANISAVVRLEEEARRQRSVSDRLSDAIANFVGSIPLWCFISAGSGSGYF